MRKRFNRKRIVLLIIAAAAIAAAVLFHGYNIGAFLPSWIKWNDKTVVCEDVIKYFGSGNADDETAEKTDVLDADNDLSGGSADEPDRIVLEDRKVNVFNDDIKVWTSDEGVKVSDILWCDIDHDGGNELMLLCWRRGLYGSSMPFWLDKNDHSWTQHIFIYDWNGEEIKPVWMASDIGMDAADWSFDETDRLIMTETNDRMTRWDWRSWGLEFLGETDQADEVSFLVTGDNIIHESIIAKADLDHEETFDFLYEDVKETIEAADVAVICQETMFINDRSEYSGYPLFGTPVEVGEAIIKAGFDAAACANNHSLDKGMEGIDDTTGFYEKNGIPYAGIQGSSDTEYRPYIIIEKGGICTAVLNYTYGTNGIELPEDKPYAVHLLEDEERIRKDIRDAKSEADAVIVIVHWGTEYAEEPDDLQKKWTDVFLEEGVNVVVGNHPHVLQKCGYMPRDGAPPMLVYYSLGNFVAAQQDHRIGGLAEFTIKKSDKGVHVSCAALEKIDSFMKCAQIN